MQDFARAFLTRSWRKALVGLGLGERPWTFCFIRCLVGRQILIPLNTVEYDLGFKRMSKLVSSKGMFDPDMTPSQSFHPHSGHNGDRILARKLANRKNNFFFTL
jgi:hypothetical protein